MIIAISGLAVDPQGNKGSAGSGKSHVALHLVEKHGFVELAFADEMKRTLRRLLGFSVEQLWGPSAKRNEPDSRYSLSSSNAFNCWPRVCSDCGATYVDTVCGTRYKGVLVEERGVCPECDSGRWHGQRSCRDPYLQEKLTPRYALQTLGEWGRSCYPRIWADPTLAMANELLNPTGAKMPLYERTVGILYEDWHPSKITEHILISDVRYQDELVCVRENGGVAVRVVRPVPKLSISNEHKSENDLNEVPDSAFDHVIYVEQEGLSLLYAQVDKMVVDLYNRQNSLLPKDSVESLGSLTSMGVEEVVSRTTYNPRAVHKVEPCSSSEGVPENRRTEPCCPLDTDGDGDCPIHPRK